MWRPAGDLNAWAALGPRKPAHPGGDRAPCSSSRRGRGPCVPRRGHPTPQKSARALNSVTPPEGDAMPPVDVIDTGSGFKVLTNLLPKSGPRRLGNGNGNGDDSDH